MTHPYFHSHIRSWIEVVKYSLQPCSKVNSIYRILQWLGTCSTMV